MLCFLFIGCFFFKQKTAYEMRISDWSSDVCSSDLLIIGIIIIEGGGIERQRAVHEAVPGADFKGVDIFRLERRAIIDGGKLHEGKIAGQSLPEVDNERTDAGRGGRLDDLLRRRVARRGRVRSEEHTSELPSLMRI